MNPEITVIIPTYNRASALKALLDSLYGQKCGRINFEIIVIADGCTDNTMTILEHARKKLPHLKWHMQNNRGPSAARNHGIKKSNAEIVAFTDDDCIVHENWIQTIHNGFLADELAGLEGIVETGEKPVMPMTHYIKVEGPGRYITCNIAFKREVLNKVGGFDESFGAPHDEDQDLALRVKEHGKIGFSKEMRVIHPPAPMGFLYELKRARSFMKSYVEGESRLYAKHPKSYNTIRYHGTSEETLKSNSMTYAW
ncbi:MAG: glycosyltransferase family A protein, partial [bacterium]